MRNELEAILAADFSELGDVEKLAGVLYDRCYTRSILDSVRSHRPRGHPERGTHECARDIEAANQSRAAWDEGWIVDQVLDDGRVLARKGGAARAFLPGEFLTHRGLGSGPEAGARISVFLAPGSSDLQSGFYFAFGETVGDVSETENLVRFYWNVSMEGAPRLMEALTREFNRFQVPFRFKCASQASDYPRRDAAVLYLNRRYYAIAALLVERVHSLVRPWLGESTPLFARRLADGLGFAEDPGDSFGKHRMKILAAAMASSTGGELQDRVKEVRVHFERQGLSLDQPWLNAGSVDVYEFPCRA